METAHATTIEQYEAELRRSSAREATLRAELRPLEMELSTMVGVYSVLQRTLAQLAGAEERADGAARASEQAMAAARDAQREAAETKREGTEALARAAADSDARKRAEDAADAAVRRAEREAAAAESAKVAAIAASDDVIASTTAGAGCLCEAVDALHRWLDGVVAHSMSSGASTLEVLQATQRGYTASPLLRGAHASLEALQTRLQYVCEEVLRLRQERARAAEDVAKLDAVLAASGEREQELRRRADDYEAAARSAAEKAAAAEREVVAANLRVGAATKAASEASQKVDEVSASLEPRRHLVCTLSVQLSDALRRSGAVDRDAPMLIDSGASAWDWERLALALSSLVSHTCYFWEAHQRELHEVAVQLKEARARIVEKEESLSRAAMIASGLKRASAKPPVQSIHGRGRSRGGDAAAQIAAAALAADVVM